MPTTQQPQQIRQLSLSENGTEVALNSFPEHLVARPRTYSTTADDAHGKLEAGLRIGLRIVPPPALPGSGSKGRWLLSHPLSRVNPSSPVQTGFVRSYLSCSGLQAVFCGHRPFPWPRRCSTVSTRWRPSFSPCFPSKGLFRYELGHSLSNPAVLFHLGFQNLSSNLTIGV